MSTETFAKTMNGASIEAQKYATNIKNGTGSSQTFATNQKVIQSSMNETSIVSQIAAAGLNLFKAALNSLIFFAVIEGIQLLIKGLDSLILTAEEAEEKAESLRNNMQSFFDEVQSGQKTISSISDRFSELNEHVTEAGENIDLTNDEYSEYLDICNQVKSIMPELISGYTNEGNAIITLKDNVDSLTESYKENIRIKAAAFVSNGDDDGNTIESFFDDYKIFTEGEGGLFAPSAGGAWNNKSTDYEDYYGYDKVHEWLSDVADLTLEDLQNLQKGTTQATYLYALLKENGYELANITEDNYEAVHDVLNTRLTSLESEMTTRVSNIKMSLQQMLYADADYWDIDNQKALSAINSLFSDVDAEFIKQNNLLGKTALQSFESNVIKLFKNDDTQQAMVDIYTPQGQDESIVDYSKRVNDAIQEIQDYVTDKQIDIPLNFNNVTNNVETLQKQYDSAIEQTKKQFEGDTSAVAEALKAAQENLQDEYAKIEDWGLGDYADQIKNGTIQSVFGNVDMDKRTIITWSDELKQTYQDELASWDYDPEIGTIDTVYGMSGRFGESLSDNGWEVAFTPILPDGTFLSADTVYDYIEAILQQAYADDGQITDEELKAIDAQGMQIGDTFVKGIYAGIDGGLNYDNNGNWAETVGRLMHFSGDFGAVNLAEQAIEEAKKMQEDFDWDSWFKENSINTKEEIDNWLEIAQAADSAAEARKRYVQGSTFEVKPFSKKEMIAEINALSEGFESLDKIMASQKDKDNPFDYALLDDKNFEEKFDDLGAVYTDFVETISDSPKDVNACQSAYDDLITAYINSSDIINGLSDETAALTVDMLTNMGVANAEEVVMGALAAKHAETAAEKYYNANASKELANATIDEYVEFLNEADVSDMAKVALAQLELAKIAVNDAKIDTASDIDQIINLANAAGASAEALAKLGRAKAILAKAETEGLNGGAGDLRMYEEAQKIIDEVKNNTYQWDFQLDFQLDSSKFKGATYSGGTKTNKSSKSSKKENKEEKETFNWMERMLEVINDKHEKINDVISDETKSYEAQQAAIANILALDEEKIALLKQQVEKYKEYWLQTLSEINEEQLKIYGNGMTKSDLIKRITEGDLEIQNFVLPEGSTDDQQEAFKELIEAIKNAQSAYKDVEDTENEIDDTEKDIEDKRKERYEKRIEQIRAENDALESKKSLIEADLDLIEATGDIELESMYQSLIDISKQQMEVYEKEADAARDRLSEVQSGSAEYYQLQSTITDCEKSIKECEIEQAEWNETIKRLPIERIQKYIAMLQNIKSDLQNFIDEKNALGIETTVDQYQQLMDISQKEIDKLLEQQEKLSDILGDYRYGSEKFNEVQEEIQEIDDTISGLIQNMNEWNTAIMNIPINNLEKINEQLSLYSSSLGEVIENYDSVLNAVTGVIDEQIDSLNDLKEATEEAYEAKIQPLEDELELLQKTNEARQKELDVEQSLYDLEKAKNQKTTQVIRNGEKVYEADEDSIREAEQSHQDALYNKKVYDLQEQISALEEERDKLLEGYDDEIDRLGKISDRWSEIKDKIQLAADTLKANEMFGSGWQDKILSGNDSDLYSMFQKLYETATSEKDKVDEQIASNDRIVTMMQRFIELYQNGSISYEKAVESINQLSNQMKDGYSAMEQLSGLMSLDGIDKVTDISASTNAKVDESVNLLGEYIAIAKSNNETLEQYTSTWTEMKENIAAQLEELERLAKELEEYVKNQKYYSSYDYDDDDDDGDYSIDWGTGDIAQGCYTSYGDGHGSYDDYYDDSKDYTWHEGIDKGLVDKDDSSREKFLKHIATEELKPDERYAKVLVGEAVFTEEQQEQLVNNFKALIKNGQMPMGEPRLFNHMGCNMITETKTYGDVNVNIGDIKLENVQNPDGFAKAMKEQIGGIVRQEASKAKYTRW